MLSLRIQVSNSLDLYTSITSFFFFSQTLSFFFFFFSLFSFPLDFISQTKPIYYLGIKVQPKIRVRIYIHYLQKIVKKDKMASSLNCHVNLVISFILIYKS